MKRFTWIESKIYTNDRFVEYMTTFLESKGGRSIFFFYIFYYLSVYFSITKIGIFMLNSVAEKSN